jgi:hypothetical protein
VNGHANPRVAPPLPRRHQAADLSKLAQTLGIDLFPWQKTAARYLTSDYREVCVIVARQNGKTTLLVPLIVQRLLAGKRIMHTAQNRDLPREVFGIVADIFLNLFPHLLRHKPRLANGQERIELKNGGIYRIVAPTRGGARGPSNDLVIIDELREMDTLDFIAAAKPTLIASPNPQIVYLSNAGTDDSIVLNALRQRQDDPGLAYLEWSAAPGREDDDREGWREANPAIGHQPGLLANLEAEYRANQLGGTMAVFETEHLCRWARDLRKTAFRLPVWEGNRLPNPLLEVDAPYALGIGIAPGWERATIAVAARRPDDRIGVEVYRDLRDKVTPQDVTDAIEQFNRDREVQTIAFDRNAGGGSEFDRHGSETQLPYDPLQASAAIRATMDVTEMITAGRLAVDDPLNDAQIPLVVRRDIGVDGAFRFSRGNSLGSIDAVEAMVFAAHAIAYRGQQPNIY